MLDKPCRTCQLDSIQGSLLVEYPELQPVEPWKWGHLYRCSRCGREWFLHDHKVKISRIHDDLRYLAYHWNETRLALGDTILDVLASIGGVMDFYKEAITIPCSIAHVSGQQFEKAVVLMSRYPPTFWFAPGLVHWAGEIASAQPSRFALPLDVRWACETKSEESMGFDPVGIVDPQGKEYTLVSKSIFFDRQGVVGQDIRLSGRQKKWRKKILPEPPEAYFFVDWIDGSANTLLKSPRKDNSYTSRMSDQSE